MEQTSLSDMLTSEAVKEKQVFKGTLPRESRKQIVTGVISREGQQDRFWDITRVAEGKVLHFTAGDKKEVTFHPMSTGDISRSLRFLKERGFTITVTKGRLSL